jgi:serine phosphatase RsbU (regulator of sigma subunit)
MLPAERDHRIAESLQRVLLRTPPPETLQNLAMEAFYEPAVEEATVCGDYFDAFAVDEETAAFVVGDASGKGLAAAERIAEVKFALRAFLREHHDPCHALSCLNDFVCDSQRLDRRDNGTFVTMTLVVLNGVSGEMACLAAGGEPPLTIRANGAPEITETGGPVLGIMPGHTYLKATAHLSGGDMVMIATDGITEARGGTLPKGQNHVPGSPRSTFLGMDGIARLARQAAFPSRLLRLIGQEVFDGARTFAGGSFRDDACLLLIRRGP